MAYLDMYSWRDAGTENTRGLSGFSSPLLAGRSPIFSVFALFASIPEGGEVFDKNRRKESARRQSTGSCVNIGRVLRQRQR